MKKTLIILLILLTGCTTNSQNTTVTDDPAYHLPKIIDDKTVTNTDNFQQKISDYINLSKKEGYIRIHNIKKISDNNFDLLLEYFDKNKISTIQLVNDKNQNLSIKTETTHAFPFTLEKLHLPNNTTAKIDIQSNHSRTFSINSIILDTLTTNSKGAVYTPDFKNIKLLPNSNYLSYELINYEGGQTKLIDLNSTKIAATFNTPELLSFTNNNQYLIICTSYNTWISELKILDLPDFKPNPQFTPKEINNIAKCGPYDKTTNKFYYQTDNQTQTISF